MGAEGRGRGRLQDEEREQFRLPPPLPRQRPHVQGAFPGAVGRDSPSPFQPPTIPLLCSLDLFFRWLFDKKFLAEAAIRFE